MINFPPGLFLIVASLVVALPFVKGRAKPVIALLSALACFGCVLLTLTDGAVGSCVLTLIDNPTIAGLFNATSIDLHLMQLNYPTKVFATVFSLMACVGIVFAFNQERNVELSGALLYAGSAICATYAGDLMSMFIFWELMAIGSTMVILDGGQKRSGEAALRYVAVHFLGGVFLMAGIIWYGLNQGALGAGDYALLINANPLAEDNALVAFNSLLAHPAAWLMLIGILVNAGAPPLGAWLPDAYAEGSPSGTVFLSAYTTKTAVFVLMMLFAGCDILIWVGLLMAIYGIVYAILENDMRRLLAYSIINQVGFMVCAIGIGSELALSGASAHAFAHILYKALLLMSVGSVLYMTGKRKCSDLGGLHRTMRWTMLCCLIGGLAMAAPMTFSFTTKSLITTSVAEASIGSEMAWTYIITWFTLILASAAIFMCAGIKLPWFVFFQKDSGLRPTDPPGNMKWAMVSFAFLCLTLGLPGVAERTVYKILPYEPMKVVHEHHAHSEGHGEVSDHVIATHAPAALSEAEQAKGYAIIDGVKKKPYSTWSFSHVITQFSIMIASAYVFFVLLNMLKRTLTISLDSDWIYRRLIPRFWKAILLPPLRAVGKVHAFILGQLPTRVANAVFARRIDHSLHKDIELGGSKFELRFDIKTNRYRQWAVGGAMVVITAMLLLYILVNEL